MDNEKLMKVYFNDDVLIIDVNGDCWEKILNKKDKIIKIETSEWSWNLLTGEVVFQ